MEFSIQILPHPPLMEKNIYFSLFIMFIITKFGENFKEKMDICFLKNV